MFHGGRFEDFGRMPKMQRPIVMLLMLVTKSGGGKFFFDMDTLNAIPIETRTTIKSIANEMKMGNSQVYRMLKVRDLRSHTNSIKSKLSHEHKLRRLNFILSQIIPLTVNTLPKFSLMYNVVHIDENWFI